MTPTEQAKRVADAIEVVRNNDSRFFKSAHILANELLRLNSDYTRYWPNPTTQQIIDHLEAGGRVEVASIAYRSWEESVNTFEDWAEYEPAQSWPAYRLVLTPPPPATEWVVTQHPTWNNRWVVGLKDVRHSTTSEFISEELAQEWADYCNRRDGYVTEGAES